MESALYQSLPVKSLLLIIIMARLEWDKVTSNLQRFCAVLYHLLSLKYPQGNEKYLKIPSRCK